MPDVRDLRAHSPPPEEQVTFRFSEMGMKLRPLSRPKGPDVVRENAEAEEDMDLDQIIEMVWRQFAPEILIKGPNKRTVAQGTHTHMSRQDRIDSDTATYKTFDLSGIFERIQYKVADAVEWLEIFDRLFPIAPEAPQVNIRRQNYDSCLYFKTWEKTIARLSRPDAKKVKDEVRKHFNKLWWMPYAVKERIWKTGKVQGSWIELPNFSGTPVVQIAFNQRFFQGQHAIQLKNSNAPHPLAQEEEGSE
ncbi:hypothetical protein JAAARDRAFT_118038 [Jaapia argillacea MUCL 33604]|uniref:Uncharacterized protein n=1 Tax=Jaapia argillacea MUCL 33604 TaxID=933084 RepID=A0A067QMN8_9AGAM|nr:hypothetical protein JAAARDRAFT_118038 [Jaapia argillacea MUCL 33604]